MLNIFSEVSAIEEIFISDSYPNWQKVIGNGVNIYLNTDDAILEEQLTGDNKEEEEESILFMWYHESDAPKRPKALGAQFQFANDVASLVQQPFGLFILDIDIQKANDLSAKYGVQIYSSQELVDIQDFEINFDFEKNELVQCTTGALKGYGFILNSFKTERSNSTIIVDRNIFANEERGLNVGVSNMIKYFDNILPSAFETSYDILFVTQNNGKIAITHKRREVIEDLTFQIKKLRTYDINIEVLFIHNSTTLFEYTHQRRILNNYHFGNSEHGFAIFSISDYYKVRNDNDFNIQVHYHSLLKNQIGNVSMKKRNKLLKRLKEIKVEAEKQLINQGQNDRYYRLYKNGEETDLIKNRLLS